MKQYVPRVAQQILKCILYANRVWTTISAQVQIVPMQAMKMYPFVQFVGLRFTIAIQ